MRTLRLRLCPARKVVLVPLLFVVCLLLYNILNKRQSILLMLERAQSSAQYDDKMDDEGSDPGVKPGAFLEGRIFSNASFCTFRRGLPEELTYDEQDLKRTPQLGRSSPYRVLYNVVEAQNPHDHPNRSTTTSVTYCTHVTADYVHHIAEIARYWDGLVSVAMFVPDVDADVAVGQLLTLCHCLPEMRRVSVHFVFPANRPSFVHSYDVMQKCTVQDWPEVQTHRSKENLPYPINVCRNVARNGATTEFVLVSDAELIPSKFLATRFAEMFQRRQTRKKGSRTFSTVYVVPIFEIEKSADIPRTKKELQELFREERAVYFHKWVCSHCQKFPGLQKWLLRPPSNNIRPIFVAKREYPYHRWEPVYIGTNDEPWYSETLSWEGQQDKMTQMLEMCLIGYRFIILDGAFLVHWPGVKRRPGKGQQQEAWRRPHIRQNSRQYDVILNDLASKYTENLRCRLQ